MAEKRLIIDAIELKYHGLFDLPNLLTEIDKISKARGYSRNEKSREERVTPSGKEFVMEIRPVKKKSAFYALMVKLRVNIHSMKDVEVEQDGRKVVRNEGEISIIFDGWTTTDYKWRRESSPVFYYLRNMFERVIGKVHTDIYIDELVDDTHFFHKNIKAYLNMHRF